MSQLVSEVRDRQQHLLDQKFLEHLPTTLKTKTATDYTLLITRQIDIKTEDKGGKSTSRRAFFRAASSSSANRAASAASSFSIASSSSSQAASSSESIKIRSRLGQVLSGRWASRRGREVINTGMQPWLAA